jgi:hypothetical protein
MDSVGKKASLLCQKACKHALLQVFLHPVRVGVHTSAGAAAAA